MPLAVPKGVTFEARPMRKRRRQRERGDALQVGLPPTSQAYPSVLLSPTFRKAETEEQRQEAITHLMLSATSEERHAAFPPPVAEVLTKSAWIALLMAAPPARSQAGPPSSGPEERCQTANGQSAHLIVSESVSGVTRGTVLTTHPVPAESFQNVLSARNYGLV